MLGSTRKGHLWKRRRRYFGTGGGDIVSRESCTWVRRVRSDGTE
jgi:hypothetical protein